MVLRHVRSTSLPHFSPEIMYTNVRECNNYEKSLARALQERVSCYIILFMQIQSDKVSLDLDRLD